MSWINEASRINTKEEEIKKEMEDNKEGEISLSDKKIKFAPQLDSMVDYMERAGLESITIEGKEFTKTELIRVIDAYWERWLREEAKFAEKIKVIKEVKPVELPEDKVKK